MKQYTDEIQTAKLIELGFEKPKMAAPALKWVDGASQHLNHNIPLVS